MTSCHPIGSVIILVIKQTRMITDRPNWTPLSSITIIYLLLSYLIYFYCLQGSLALGRLLSIPIALFLSPAIMLLVDLVGCHEIRKYHEILKYPY